LTAWAAQPSIFFIKKIDFRYFMRNMTLLDPDVRGRNLDSAAPTDERQP
jgi:hypothetical protein